jgi:hypothetical protein
MDGKYLALLMRCILTSTTPCQGLSQKYKAQLEGLRKLADHARNYSEYRGRLRNTSPPAVPFLGKFFDACQQLRNLISL